MIRAVQLKDNSAFIPLLGTPRFICLSWNFDEDAVDKFENKTFINWCSLRCNICFDEAWRCSSDVSSITQILHVYEVIDSNTQEQFFLVSFNEIKEVDDIAHCVALPYNKLNLIKFYKDYVMTFPDGKEQKDEDDPN